jgi:dihydrofolate synthase/folylpolyglutamate synthase
MTYAELLARLYAARRFGVKLGLERMRAVLDELGTPDARLGRVVHVAGTNGKGSTVAMLAALATSGGARVATYTSPHLSTLRERVVIAGELASEAALADAGARVLAAASRAGLELTFFEAITAIGMDVIARAGVDITVLEVGLGGRLDATNVVSALVAPVAVITGVAMDHEAILGDTLAAIAREKAGIVKPGQHVVIGASGEPEGQGLLVELARAAGAARVEVVDHVAIAAVPAVSLAGAHQRANAAAALAGIRALGVPHDPRTLASVRHPGRFERIAPDVIVDGAHNPHGARALAATLRAEPGTWVLVLAVSADKDALAIAAALAPVARAIVATRYGQERALVPEALAQVCREVAPGKVVEAADDLPAALAAARRLASGATIVVAGSLFLVGEARVLLAGAEADPIALSDPAAVSKTKT